MLKVEIVVVISLFSILSLSVAALAQPVLLQETGRLVSPSDPGLVNQITIDENYLYASLDNGGLEIRDRFTGDQLSVIRVDPAAYAVQFQLRDNYAYIADWGAGLTILDITDKTNPIHVGTWDDWYTEDGSFARGVVLSGEKCFLSICDYGIVTIDISDPTAPVKTGLKPELVDIHGNNHRLASLNMHKQGDRLISETYRSLNIYDIGDPDHISVCASNPSYPCAELYYDASRDLMLTSCYWTSSTMFRTFDVSDPDNPFLLTTYCESLPESEIHHIHSIDLVGDYLFAGDSRREFIVYDFTDPFNPERIAYFPLPEDVRCFTGGFAVDGDTAYLGTFGSGIIQLDISPLNVPEPASFLLLLSLLAPVGMRVLRGRS